MYAFLALQCSLLIAVFEWNKKDLCRFIIVCVCVRTRVHVCVRVCSMDLIAQYSRLSEEAAKRERRAVWKVQRMRLDEARVSFLQQDQQAIQVRC